MAQRERLEAENTLLGLYMSHFVMHDLNGDTYIEGLARTCGRDREYGVRLDLGSNFPHEKPGLHIVSPSGLETYYGRSLSSIGNSHSYHTLDSHSGRGVRICHTKNWDASITCVNILAKAHLWLEAYEAHLQTGRALARFLVDA